MLNRLSKARCNSWTVHGRMGRKRKGRPEPVAKEGLPVGPEVTKESERRVINAAVNGNIKELLKGEGGDVTTLLNYFDVLFIVALSSL